MLRNKALPITAVDMAVTGLQKHPISAKVLKVGIREFPGSGISIDKAMEPENRGGKSKQMTLHNNEKKLVF